MKNKFIVGIGILLIVLSLGRYAILINKHFQAAAPQTETIAVKPVSSEITADGVMTAQNQATLHFQTGGKLTYLPYKEGDAISQGQTIAQLDTYALQRQLTQALNTYKLTRNTFDQTQQNAQDNVLQNQEKPLTAGAAMDQNNAVNDAVKRIVDTNQANLDNAVINVELATYAQQLATITSPLTGIVTHEDVTIPYVNVTPITSFTVADPSTLVFRANVSDSDIDFVSEGASARIVFDGSQTPIGGTVEKIYPTKITLQNGQQGYQVDIIGDSMRSFKLDQSGTVIIKSTAQQSMTLVPVWTVLGSKYIWVEENNSSVLKSITVGKIHGNMIEVLTGLSSRDSVITNPEMLPAKQYQLL